MIPIWTLTRSPGSTRRATRPARSVAAFLVAVVVTWMAWTPAVAQDAGEVVVRITDRLEPTEALVAPGTVVTWVNQDSDRHRIRGLDDAAYEVDSGNLEPGERFSYTFGSTGTLSYVDDRDREDAAYHGVVRVTEVGAPPTPDPGSSGTGSGSTTGSGPGSTSSDPGAGTSDGAGGTMAPTTATVGMAGRVFSPREVTIAAGGSVTWRNDDDREHTVTDTADGFDSGTMAQGATYRRAFPEAGRFSYLCLIHPDMTGTVDVLASDGSAPASSGSSEPSAATSGSGETGTSSSPAGSSGEPSSDTGEAGTSPSGGGGTDGGAAPSGGAGGAAPASSGTVALRDFLFAPSSIEIAAGGSVRFVNEGRAPHTATAAGSAFDTGILGSGEAATQLFPEPGTYAFVCRLHPEMTGTIRVIAGAGSAVSGGAGAAASGRAPGGGAEAGEGQLDDGAGGGAASGSSVGAGVGSGTGSGAAAGERVEASIVDNAFEPASIEVPVGSVVAWSNDGRAPHTVTAADRSFDSGILDGGDGFEQRFDQVGTYTYVCSVHPEMQGEVRVVAAAAGEVSAVSAVGAVGAVPGATGALAGASSSGGPSPFGVQLLVLGIFALGLAAFTVASARFAAADRP